jgi:4-hydroxyphenylpyruvate dioxygenase-like putative hemolysin
MATEIGHVYIKTHDPKKTARSYIDNFNATMKSEAANGNIQLNLHGLQLNVTIISAAQKRKQMMGIEHTALRTDDYAGVIIKLKSNGAHIMLAQVSNGRHAAFIEARDGAQMELIEKM